MGDAAAVGLPARVYLLAFPRNAAQTARAARQALHPTAPSGRPDGALQPAARGAPTASRPGARTVACSAGPPFAVRHARTRPPLGDHQGPFALDEIGPRTSPPMHAAHGLSQAG